MASAGGVLLTIATGAERVSFEREIRPILSERCFSCHGPDAARRQADVRLDVETGLGDVLVAGDSDSSELFRRIATSDPDERMPPADAGPPLNDAEIARIREWIDSGAAWDEHWAYTPIVRPQVPLPSDAADARNVRNPIDRFVQARLQEDWQQGPAREARRGQLIRRVTLDLTGLPPDPSEVEAFAADRAPDAYERLVEQLLASPAFGERHAWDWLDVARYADSNGYQGDADRTMWPWRDWVVSAINRNLSFDEFTIWQLAGDLLPQATLEQRLATGFCRNHAINGEGGRIPEENRVDYAMDMVETMGTAWLGLTLNCCRCHDHKFDPITRREYYQLFAYFNQTPVDGSGGNPQTAPVVEIMDSQLQAKLAAAQLELQRCEQALQSQGLGNATAETRSAADTLSAPPGQAEQKARRDAAQQVLDAIQRQIPRVMVMADTDVLRPTHMLERGLYNQLGDLVSPNVPAQLSLASELAPNRLGLAQWITADENRLTARVIVNRYWQQLFHVGLVKTSEDFGVQGERPLHRELLDWLAAEFISHGWDVKHLLRLIVTSHTYRQSSQVSGAAEYQRDPENRYLSRGPRYRLPAWMLRDQALAVSGLLASQLAGPPVRGYQPAGVWEEATFGQRKYEQDHGALLYRRSLYTFWRRIAGPPMFFDNAGRQVCSVKVFHTNTPLHALVTLNDITFVEAARALATRSLRAELNSDRARIAQVYRAVLARQATDHEADILLQGLDRTRRQYAANQLAAQSLLAVGETPCPSDVDPIELASWTNLCLTVLNLDETLNKE